MAGLVEIQTAARTARFIGAEMPVPITVNSRWHGVNCVSALFATVDHEDISVLLNIVSGDPLPIIVAKSGPGVMAFQHFAIAEAPLILRVQSGLPGGVSQ